MADEIKWLDRRIAGFEVINETEIKRRLEFLSDRTLKMDRKLVA